MLQIGKTLYYHPANNWKWNRSESCSEFICKLLGGRLLLSKASLVSFHEWLRLRPVTRPTRLPTWWSLECCLYNSRLQPYPVWFVPILQSNKLHSWCHTILSPLGGLCFVVVTLRSLCHTVVTAQCMLCFAVIPTLKSLCNTVLTNLCFVFCCCCWTMTKFV